MSASTYQQEHISVVRSTTDWGAIWAGVFTFAAIWSVFELLGAAIFASAASPSTATTSTGMSVGMGIWTVILTAIAMFAAGSTTGRLAAVTTRRDGLIYGTIMFGLSVVFAVVVVGFAGGSLSGGASANSSVQGPYFMNVLSTLGWTGFFSLALGWGAALWGGSAAVKAKVRSSEALPAEGTVHTMRPAA
jgi:hypothetical protein